MFRFLMIAAACCAFVPSVLSNSAGAPINICTNNLTPEHGLDGQSSPVPYTFSGADGVHTGEAYTLKLSGNGVTFLGFAVQARDADQKPIGKFKIIESNKSQTLTCSGSDDTLTHKKLPSGGIDSVEVQWIAPKNLKGKVSFVGTVAMDGGTYWIRKVLKSIVVA